MKLDRRATCPGCQTRAMAHYVTRANGGPRWYRRCSCGRYRESYSLKTLDQKWKDEDNGT